ncbi:hypothetical protein D3C81_1696400 [compost metagenome]
MNMFARSDGHQRMADRQAVLDDHLTGSDRFKCKLVPPSNVLRQCDRLPFPDRLVTSRQITQCDRHIIFCMDLYDALHKPTSS